MRSCFTSKGDFTTWVFVTGATGFIGSAVVPELIAAGHQVLGLIRSDAGAKSLAAAGAQAHHGSLEDLESLRKGAAQSDAVIHLAFIHDFSNFAQNCETDRRAIEAMSSVLAGSDRPLLVTSATGAVHTPGRPSTEDDPANSPLPRVASEHAVDAAAARGVRASVVRLPQVHDPVKQGLITYLVAVALQKGVSAYVGEGLNRWPAAHVLDTAHLYRLALEKGLAGARYHAVDEEGVPLRDIAQSLGRALNLPVVCISPEQAAEHFGWLAHFVAADIPSSSKRTRSLLGWQPKGPSLIADLDKAQFAA